VVRAGTVNARNRPRPTLIPLGRFAGILERVTLSTKTVAITADSPYLGRRIDHLVQELVVLPRAQVTGLFDHGCVRRNGILCQTPGERLSEGDRIEIAYDVHRRYHPKPRVRRNLGFQIVFEDQHLIVVIKPAELLTVPTSRGETNTLQNKVEEYVRHVSKGRGAFTVHRLDRGVSGLLVFGKSEAIVRELKDQFAASKPEREYVAIVAGSLEQSAGTFESLLATDRDLNRFSTDDESIGQLAITHFRKVADLAAGKSHPATLVQVRLETGRRNQIRVHFAEARHPILGDTRYQPELARHPRWHHPRMALHARLLGFEHPRTGEMLRHEAELPAEMKAFVADCRLP
jgi:23S rRNA pseudouridine1911/1915/1917 synthase